MSIVKWLEVESEQPSYEEVLRRLKQQSTAKKYVVSYQAKRFFFNKTQAKLFLAMIKSGAQLTELKPNKRTSKN